MAGCEIESIIYLSKKKKKKYNIKNVNFITTVIKYTPNSTPTLDKCDHQGVCLILRNSTGTIYHAQR
jgi:hypothetical protein